MYKENKINRDLYIWSLVFAIIAIILFINGTYNIGTFIGISVNVIVIIIDVIMLNKKGQDNEQN